MGVICSDRAQCRNLHDLRYLVDEIDNCELSDSGARSTGTCSGCSSPPLIKRVPVSVKHRLVYRDEKKKREIFFDLDSVDEVNGCVEKAFSDITSIKFKSRRCSLLSEGDLSTPVNESAPSQLMLSLEESRPSSVRSAQVGRSSSCNLEVWKTPMSSANTAMGSSKIAKKYSTDERSLNTSLEKYWKPESDSDSLNYERKQTAANDSLEAVFHENQLANRDAANKEVLSPQKTIDTDQTSHRSSNSPACSSHNRQYGGYNTFKYPGPTLRVSEGGEIDKEDDIHVGLIFKALCDEDILGEASSKTDYTSEENEHVVLP